MSTLSSVILRGTASAMPTAGIPGRTYYTSDTLQVFLDSGSAWENVTSSLNSAAISAIQQETYVYAADSGTANAYAVTLTPAPTLVAGSLLVVKAANANTGASTIAVNGGSAVAITKQGGTALTGGEIHAGQVVFLIYDGTEFQVLGGVGSPTPIATTSAPGIVQPDGATIDVNGSGVISVPTATTSALGLVKPDGTTITISNGILTGAAGGSGNATSIQGVAVSNTAPTTGQVLEYNGTDYVPTTPVQTVQPSNIQQETYVYAPDTSATANQIVVSLTPTPTIVAGSKIAVKIANANTGATTIAVNGAAAVAVTKNGATALAGGELAVGQIVILYYDGTQYQLVGDSASSGTPTGVLLLNPSGSQTVNVPNATTLTLGSTSNSYLTLLTGAGAGQATLGAGTIDLYSTYGVGMYCAGNHGSTISGGTLTITSVGLTTLNNNSQNGNEPGIYLNSAIYVNTTTVTANYTVGWGDYTILVNASSGPITITLPNANPAYINVPGKNLRIKKIDTSANAVTIVPKSGSGSLIDGATSQQITTAYGFMTLHSDLTNWWIF